jgi:hypothetical protein
LSRAIGGLARLITLPEACMRYLAEIYYLQDQRGFPFRKAVTVTATVVARWCDYFYAKIIAPTTKRVKLLERSGSLPSGIQEKEAFVAELLKWLFEHSITDELFCLLMDDKPVPQAGIVSKFDHHDDTCCWVLNLDDNQFSELQTRWREQGLPEDLFYPEWQVSCVPYPGEGVKAKLLRTLGMQKMLHTETMEKRTLTNGDQKVVAG